jgi:hypothetical protein
MIKPPGALTHTNKKVRMLIAGFPGIGKTTIAMSAPKPLHVDTDKGNDRIAAAHRKDFIHPETYDELLHDLVPATVNGYETLVFDTGGQLFKLMSAWAIRQDSKNGQRSGALSLKGYGAVGREFERLINYCYYELNKHLVVIFHAKEEKDGDSTRLRVLIEGQTKDNIWQPMDLGGFIEMHGNGRTIGFTNCERYFAKGTHGIFGVHPIPHLEPGTPNDFLTKLFAQVNENIAAEAKGVESLREGYNATMEYANTIIADIRTPEDATAARLKIKGLEHHLTSEKESIGAFIAKVNELGFKFDREKEVYLCAS